MKIRMSNLRSICRGSPGRRGKINSCAGGVVWGGSDDVAHGTTSFGASVAFGWHNFTSYSPRFPVCLENKSFFSPATTLELDLSPGKETGNARVSTT